MKPRVAYLSILIMALSLWMGPVSAQAKSKGIGMVTGSKTGTYIQFGRNIAEVADEAGLEIIVKQSEGSMANIKRMVSKENAGLGIVQSDVLGFLKRSNDAETRRIASQLRLVFPFYNEEVHLFARRDIRNPFGILTANASSLARRGAAIG